MIGHLHLQVRVIIKAASGEGAPVGWMNDFAGDHLPRGFLVCDGSFVSVAEYPDLYAALGDQWCRPTIRIPRALTRWQRIKAALGFRTPLGFTAVPNPEYRAGMFRLPDFRSQFLQGASA